MLSWRELSQQLQQLVTSIVRFIKARRREEAAIGLAAILFWLGYSFPKLLTPELHAWVGSWRYSGLLIIPGVFYTAGAGFFFFGLYRIWQVVHSSDLPLPRNRPSVIKGPVAFTPADGELFRRLGREDELSKLLGFVEDDQVRMVVLMGASGAGKTSLLRAGLTDALKGKGIDYHYWEAVPTSPGHRLLRAIQESWQTDAARDDNSACNAASFAKPESLDDLINPSSSLGERRHVIVLDQFEQLHGSGANNPIIRLLRKVAREAKPPHRVTWIIAFRREFRAEWEDFTLPEKERGIYPAEISLRLFTAEQARDVISQLINEARLSIQQKVVDNLVEAATVEGVVSPVDIGIGLLVLAELHDRQGGQTVTLGDYQFAGGAEGLLTQYISRCLDIFPEADREIILKAMLALRKPLTNQRIAEGRTCAQLAQETKADAGRLKIQLERLTQRDIRLLEVIALSEQTAPHYRIPHERLIPALHRMAGQLLTDVDQAKLKFENAYTAWSNSGKKRQYLLKTKELRLVQRYETQIPWSSDELEKRAFLRRSQRWRTLSRLGLAATVICLTMVTWIAATLYQRYESKAVLKDNNYPPELYDWQEHFKILKLTEPLNVQRLPWLHSSTLEEIEISVTRSTSSLNGLADSLARCRALKTLHLDLSDSEVRDLSPLENLTGLTRLTLNLRDSEVMDLAPLENLTGLTQLSLDLSGSQVRDLSPLENLTGLTQLNLNLNLIGFNLNSASRGLVRLERLTDLTQLNLDLSDSEVRDLSPLENLTGLTRLTLNLRDSEVMDLAPLENLTGLTQLSLDLGDSKVKDLTPLENLTALTHLSLSFDNPRVTNLKSKSVVDLTSLSKLKALTQLSINLGGNTMSNMTPLENLTGLTQLSLDLSGSEVRDLSPLENLTGLTQLNLNLSERILTTLEQQQRVDLRPLVKLTGLTQLSLTGSVIRDLSPLENLAGLTRLDLTLIDKTESLTAIKQSLPEVDLTPLEKLTGLRQFSLSVAGVRDLAPVGKLAGLTQLSLDLYEGGLIRRVDLTPLEKLTGLTQLSLSGDGVIDLTSLANLVWLKQFSLSVAGVRDLAPVGKLAGLTQLSLELSNSNVRDLAPLEKLAGLKHLSIVLSGGETRDLTPLQKLTHCQTLVLRSRAAQRMSLKAIPVSVTHLEL